MKKSTTQNHPRRKGAVIVLYAIATFTLVLFLGMSLDVGFLYTQKGFGQTISDITALTVLGTTDTSVPQADQQIYITNQVRNMEKENGLTSPFYDIEIIWDQKGDAIRLILNAINPLPTLVMNLVGISEVNVGIEAIAERGFLRSVVEDCPDGNLGIFACIRLDLRGKPLFDSYRSDGGTYTSQANTAGPCRTYANNNLLSASNRLVDMRGNFCYNGDTRSGLDTNLRGSGKLTGNVDTENFTGNDGLIGGELDTKSIPEINLPAAVATATADSNDNAWITGHNLSKIASPNFELKANGGSHEIQLAAGKRYYFRKISIPSSVNIRIVGDPIANGPVEINLAGEAKINGDIVSNTNPIRPGWLKITGLDCNSACCLGCSSSGEGHRGSHGGHDDGHDSGSEHASTDTHEDSHHTDTDTHDTHSEPDPCAADEPPDDDPPDTHDTHDDSHDTDTHDDTHDDGHASLGSNQLPSALNLPALIAGLAGPAWKLPNAVNLAALPVDGQLSPAWMLPNAINLATETHDDDTHDTHDDDTHDDDTHDDDTHDDDTHEPPNNSPKCQIKFSGKATIYADIYAPGYNVTATGCANIHGRIMADEIQFKGNSRFHYDETLGACLNFVSDETSEDGERVHLVN